MDVEIAHTTAPVHLVLVDDLDPALGLSLLVAELVPGGESLQDVGALLDGNRPLGIDVAVHLSAGGALAPGPSLVVHPLIHPIREQGNGGQLPHPENFHVALTPPALPEDEVVVPQD